MVVPGDNGVTRGGRADLGERSIGRGVTWIAGHQGAPEARAAVLGAVVAKPDWTRGRRGSAGRREGVSAAVVVGAADYYASVARIHADRRLVLATAGY